MKPTPVDFRPLLVLLKTLYLLCIAVFMYLVFGDVLASFWEEPAAVAERSFSPSVNDILDDYDKIENGIHLQTGLVYAEGFELVRATCTACHSAKLVTQNRATREGWQQMIRWMQETQGLWELGPSERPILSYLAKHYAPEEIGRRANIDIAAVEWYILELPE